MAASASTADMATPITPTAAMKIGARDSHRRHGNGGHEKEHAEPHHCE
jgi:hypothetical protein